MDVAQLLHKLSLCEDIEVVVPCLPEPVPRTSELPWALSLQHAQGVVQTFRLRLAQQKMHVFIEGHPRQASLKYSYGKPKRAEVNQI